MKSFLYWLPRALAILITTFWFAFVFFSYGLTIETLRESGVWIILLLLTIFAWQEKLMGKLGFILLGLVYTFAVWNKTINKLTILGVVGPLLLTGVLFLFSKKEYNLPKPKVEKPALQEKDEDNGRII